MMKSLTFEKRVDEIIEEHSFSGVVHIKKEGETVLQKTSGLYNRSESLPVQSDTRFAIASGCKLFTAIAICQLVEKELLTFDTRLTDCLDIAFPNFSRELTIHHLLTHSSGIPDYFDESVMDDYEDLWKTIPMYQVRKLEDFLPLFQQKEQMFKPGERFHYNNAGYIVLGLVVEQLTGMDFTDYVEENIFKRCDMTNSGYFSLDRLPRNTAIGYIDEDDGSYRTNTFTMPLKGGSDGGAYVTSADMIKLWEGLLADKLLSESMTKTLLSRHMKAREDAYYGYGVWLNMKDGQLLKYHVMGYDPGVSFHSAVYPEFGLIIAIPSNQADGPFFIMKAIEEELVNA
ncbi:serine hydrolase domain-containing protein [Pseudalkalibacillus sp. Hm43]|uniref:serine hydrolase domain-containing protein n=1 Tax=Pseudalkalibacillus sp. Hm43 TaxID=3450742 RepID=UPI003F4372D5